MKTVFISNYFNHHQKAMSDALFSLTDGQYNFISTGQMREDRKKLGYAMDAVPEYVKESEGECLRDEALGAELLIWGSCPLNAVKERLKNKKLTFTYSERIFKTRELAASLGRAVKYSTRLCLNASNSYLLCAGAYAAGDYNKLGLFKNKTYKWGYFPETRYYEEPEKLISDKNKNTILWVGRMLEWKHPEQAIELAKRLKSDGFSFQLKMIGTGEKEEEMRQLITENELSDCVLLTGAMSPQQVRANMEKTQIFVFTSDRQEGWGAVLNEAMNSCCSVVASHEIGSVPYLIEDGKNGFVYKSGDIDMLYSKVKSILEQPEKQRKLGMEAYSTITELWNAQIAAERLLNIAQRITNGEKYPDIYDSGPCSKAKVMSDKWQRDCSEDC